MTTDGAILEKCSMPGMFRMPLPRQTDSRQQNRICGSFPFDKTVKIPSGSITGRDYLAFFVGIHGTDQVFAVIGETSIAGMQKAVKEN